MTTDKSSKKHAVKNKKTEIKRDQENDVKDVKVLRNFTLKGKIYRKGDDFPTSDPELKKNGFID